MSKFIITAIALLVSQTATADLLPNLNKEDFSLIIGGFSKHYEDNGQNEQHRAIGFQYKEFLITYVNNNSYNNESIYAAYVPTYSPEILDGKIFSISFHGMLGIATGYEEFNTTYSNSETTVEATSEKGMTTTTVSNYYDYIIGCDIFGEYIVSLVGVGVDLNVTEHHTISSTFLPNVVMFNYKYNF